MRAILVAILLFLLLVGGLVLVGIYGPEEPSRLLGGIIFQLQISTAVVLTTIVGLITRAAFSAPSPHAPTAPLRIVVVCPCAQQAADDDGSDVEAGQIVEYRGSLPKSAARSAPEGPNPHCR